MNKIYATKGVVYAFLIVLIATWITQIAVAGTPLVPPGQPRYLSMSIMNVEDDDSYLPIMERAAKLGVNSFVLNVNWDHVYRKRGTAADWSQVDKEAELAKRLGCKIMLRVWVARHSDGKEGTEGWWPSDVRPVSGDGVRHKDLNGFSFSASEAVNEANSFVREAMQHFRPRQQAGEIVLVTVVANNASEIGYSVDAQNPVNQKNELQLFDYSYHSKIDFRNWLQSRYQTLAGLNKSWSADYSRFSDIEPPYIKGDVWSGHYGNAGMDWYLFRHYVLKRTINGFVNTVRGVDGSYRYYNDMGSVYDGISTLRATLGFIDLSEKTDGLKVNDGPYYPHRFAADLLRSNLPGKIIGNELGNVNGLNEGVWRDFINESYEHGADWFNLFGIDRDFNFVHYENLIKETAAKWLNGTVQQINPTQTVTYTLSEAIRQGTDKVLDRWRQEYAKTKKPIRVLLTEDLLGTKPSENQLPQVANNIPDQQGKVDQSFAYEIPIGTFTDPDGTIASITATGLPSGITFNDRKFAGRPTASGEFTVTVTARDDKGGEVATQFSFKTTQKNAGNLSPKASKPIPDQQGKVGQAFSYEIARETFTDPDGSIASIAAKGLPDGLSLDGWKIKGNPTASGEFNVTVTARDDQGAEVSVQFKFRVESKESGNELPQLGKAIPNQQGKVGEKFDYTISKESFFDPDGPIIDITVKGLPNGLSHSGWQLAGTPTASGEFTVTVTARDSRDATVATQFKLTVDPREGGNKPPLVSRVIPNQQGKVGQAFDYEIAKETFTDPDGTITGITATGLPDGISLNGWKMAGIPVAGGYFNVTITARDDKGAEVSAQFKLTVVLKEGTNQPPLISRVIPDQQGKVGQPFSYEIAGGTFKDPDGTIVSLSASGLPEGITLTNSKLSGSPVATGYFNVTITARDDKGAEVAAQFKFRVDATKGDNVLPLVRKTIPDQQGKVGENFDYTISKETFFDPDGPIIDITVKGLPDGLSQNKWQLAGTPTASGEFTVTVTARDSRDARVATQFKLTVAPKDSGNKSPLVSRAIPDQQGRVGQVFGYEIAKATFTDPDGTIVGITATGLPDGISLNGWKMAGIPVAGGYFNVTITARDDQGAEVSAQFKFRVDATQGENVLPLVRKTIPDQRGKVGENFDYTISKETFFDPDGPIIDIKVKGLPDGLSQSGWRLAGTPAASGVFTVTVTARDSRDAMVATQFKLTVAPKEGENKPPLVSRAIPDQQGMVGQTFSYEIPAETFEDPDGSIAGLNAKGLPDGITLTDHKLSGSPAASGEYSVSITARDDKGAEVSAQFNFKVVPKDVTNQPPLVSGTIPDQQGKVGQSFSYEILKETFTDPDGTIVGISAKGLPGGLALNGWKLAGTPAVSGKFGVTITARDNQGAEVSTQFKISVGAAPTNNVFSLFQAGNFLTRRFLHYIVDGDTLRGEDAKSIVNILVSPKTGGVGSYAFKMEGPYSVGSTDNKAPYGVFGDNGGVVFAAGTYTLNVKSYEEADLEGAQLSDETIRFVVVDDPENQNQVPVLVKPPVELFAKVGTPFAHRLPDSTFVDPDGIITSFTITALPDGLKGEGTLIAGTPTKKGVFTVKVGVTDNGGGAAETTFKFTVSSDNLPPVANGKIPDQTTPVNQPFSYTIAESVFTDPDGTIASVTIQGLPEGMTSSGRTMSGTPTKAGKYSLVAVAKDDADATAQLSFSLTVVDENRPPLVARAINDQVADSNAVYRFVIPAGTFIDLDGKIARLEISGLPDQLVAQGDTISGRLTQSGVYTIGVKAFDDKDASVQLTFRLTVRGNRPPLVVKAINDQIADSSAAYRFVIPAGTFIDTDGRIARLEISGLPAGLSAKGDTISGRPTKVGEFLVTVQAFDDKNASVQLTFKLTVRGGNTPPVAVPVPDLIAIVGQVFHFDVKNYFKDADGSIASVTYASALPPGITANGSLLAGNPAAAGDYPMKVVAKDDKGASVTIEFTIRVQRPELHVLLYESGQQPKKIREIANADIIALSTLPASLDLYVESNADVSVMTFELTGPTGKKSTDEAAPFGLFDNGSGFKPEVGTYRLQVTAYRNNTVVTTRSIQFDIIKANNVPVRLGVEEQEVFPAVELWKAYPNPFLDMVRVQMAGDAIPKTVELLSVEGRSTLLDESKWRVERSLLEVNLTEEAAQPGIYLLRITPSNGKARTLRIMKAAGK